VPKRAFAEAFEHDVAARVAGMLGGNAYVATKAPHPRRLWDPQ
jgi:hypothetical protein